MPLRRFYRSPWFRWTFLVLIAAWGLYQTFWHLKRATLQSDETVYWNAGWAYVHGNYLPNLEHPPFAKYLMGWSMFVFGPGVGTARIVVAALSFAVGIIIFLWLRRDVGWWTGTLAAAMWWLLPRGLQNTLGDPSRIDRLAFLDGPMAAFLVGSLWCAWRWASGGRIWWLIPSGILLALAGTSKEVAAVTIPAFIMLAFFAGRRRSTFVGIALFVVFLAATFLWVYKPIGAVKAIKYMISFQGANNSGGHLVYLAGHVYTHAPWWANFWLQWTGTGALVTTVLVLGTAAAIALRPSRLLIVLGAPVVCFMAFFCLASNVALAEYYIAWMPFITMLAAVGITAAAVRVRPAWLGAGLATIVVLALGFSAVRLSYATNHIRPLALSRVTPILAGLGRAPDAILGTGLSSASGAGNFGNRYAGDTTAGEYGAVLVGDDPRFGKNPKLVAFLKAHRSQFSQVDLDGTSLWIPKGTLIVTQSQGFRLVATPPPPAG